MNEMFKEKRGIAKTHTFYLPQITKTSSFYSFGLLFVFVFCIYVSGLTNTWCHISQTVRGAGEKSTLLPKTLHSLEGRCED